MATAGDTSFDSYQGSLVVGPPVSAQTPLLSDDLFTPDTRRRCLANLDITDPFTPPGLTPAPAMADMAVQQGHLKSINTSLSANRGKGSGRTRGRTVSFSVPGEASPDASLAGSSFDMPRPGSRPRFPSRHSEEVVRGKHRGRHCHKAQERLCSAKLLPAMLFFFVTAGVAFGVWYGTLDAGYVFPDLYESTEFLISEYEAVAVSGLYNTLVQRYNGLLEAARTARRIVNAMPPPVTLEAVDRVLWHSLPQGPLGTYIYFIITSPSPDFAFAQPQQVATVACGGGSRAQLYPQTPHLSPSPRSMLSGDCSRLPLRGAVQLNGEFYKQ
eukprot:gene3393-3873_t